MLQTLFIENFKCFENYKIEFERLNLLVGGNNSGKTTIFHALQFFFWSIEQIVSESQQGVKLGRTQTSEIPVVPYAEIRDLFFRQRLRSGRTPTRIKITLQAHGIPNISIVMYQAYGRNFMISGDDLELTHEQYQIIKTMDPVFVPSTVGITAREDYYRPIALRSMMQQGRQNQVLRNLVLQLSESGEWNEFTEYIRPLFQLQSIAVPSNHNTDLWLRAIYDENGCKFDFLSAGSGFLQIVNLLTLLFRSPTKVALLDEPDSHMHEDLLRLAFDLLDRLSEERHLQLLIATHSPILIDSAGLSNVLLIDRIVFEPRKAQDIESLVPLLSDQGLSLPPSKVMDTLRSRRALFVEGEEKDYEQFIRAFGEVVDQNFRIKIRGLSVFQIGEGRKDWPFDAIRAFENLIGTGLDYLYISDRDFLIPDEVNRREARATEEGQKIRHLERRNRECYLVEPKVLSRLLERKWLKRNHEQQIPNELSEQAIKEWFLTRAKDDEDSIRTALTVENENYLRGDAQYRTEKMRELNLYFRQKYTDSLSNNEIPYCLLDGKRLLREFRSYISNLFRLNFNDIEIIQEFESSEIQEDILNIINDIQNMFTSSHILSNDSRPGFPPKEQQSSSKVYSESGEDTDPDGLDDDHQTHLFDF